MFTLNITPRLCETDGLGHINNTVLAQWFEAARSPFIKFFSGDCELDFKSWKLILVHADYDFKRQIYHNTDIEIKSYVTKIGNSSFNVFHELRQCGKLCATGNATTVHYDFEDDKTICFPDEIREKLNEHLFVEEN